MLADRYERMDPAVDEITLVSGDGDYVPTVQRLRTQGPNVLALRTRTTALSFPVRSVPGITTAPLALAGWNGAGADQAPALSRAASAASTRRVAARTVALRVVAETNTLP